MSLLFRNNTTEINNSKQSLINKLIFSFASSFFVLMISTQFHLSYAEDNIITVYKSPTCGCCSKWVSHLEDNGFKVNSINSSNMSMVKTNSKVPSNFQSCHTAIINGYVIEGHVPAKDIQNLLTNKSHVAGLAVPGMPIGSPGMPGIKKDKYSVYSFDKNGNTKVVATY